MDKQSCSSEKDYAQCHFASGQEQLQTTRSLRNRMTTRCNHMPQRDAASLQCGQCAEYQAAEQRNGNCERKYTNVNSHSTDRNELLWQESFQDLEGGNGQ